MAIKVQMGDLVRVDSKIRGPHLGLKLFVVPSSKISSGLQRDDVGTLTSEMFGLVLEEDDNGDVRVLCSDGVGWMWRGNLERVT